MSASYLQVRNGHYHLRLRTPSDLLEVFPQREFTKSLRTSDIKTAKVSALPYLQGISKIFALLRSGYISLNQAQASLSELLEFKPKACPSPREKHAQKSNMEAVRLSSVIETYTNDKAREWAAKTKLEATGVYKLIIDLLGDIPIQTIDRPMIRNFRDNMLKLPPNLSKKYADIEPIKLLAMHHSKTMSAATVNKHMSFVSSLLSFAVKEGHRTDNPASGMTIKLNRKQSEERKPYDRGDIQKIIKALPRSDIARPERFWIPMICMFQGMRLDEASQLYKEDIKQIDGVWSIDINDSKDKKLKNAASNRIIPVHPRLISLGFIDYVEDCRAERLWDNLTWCELHGYSNIIGRWYQRFNREFITDDPLKTFHSLRHSFADTLKQKAVEKSMVAELMGHSEGSQTFGRYGKAYQPGVLLDVIRKVDYNVRL